MTILDGPAPPDSDVVKDGTDQGFMADVIEASRNQPVVVDFWAPWCGPCLSMAPEFEKAGRALEPHARLAKVDTEAQQNLGRRFNIRSIPTMVMFRAGKEVARQSGAMGAGAIEQWVRANSR
jgi:thioredoxin 2